MSEPTSPPADAQRRAPATRGRVLAIACSALGAILSTLLVLIWIIPLPSRLNHLDSTVIEYRDGTIGHTFLAPDDRWRIRVPLSKVDSRYRTALLRLEDKRFYSHFGVDPIAAVRSLVLNIRRGRVISGASTITMQLVRLLEPRPRTLRSKLVESFRALQLERRLSKDQILENYLRFLPFGRNVEGVETAALTFFGHRAESLSPDEVATLLAVPQAPNSRYPCAKNQDRLTAARDGIAKRLLALKSLPRGPDGVAITDLEVHRTITGRKVPAKYAHLPRLMPHIAWWLKGQDPGAALIRTSIDRGAQAYMETLMEATGVSMKHKGVRHGAAVLIEHDTGLIRAAVGSFNFHDDDAGQIPGFLVKRSPGSTLKPILYGLAIHHGLALPSYLVRDVPVAYGNYQPQNYTGQFNGVVRLRDALSRSLNIPFVDLLAQIGVPEYIDKLRQMGAPSLSTHPGAYGLSAAVGGLEVSPLEVASIYATLSTNGSPRPVTALSGQADAGAPSVIAPGAAWLTRRALRLRDRPDFPARRALSGTPRSIHWKTGTSAGHLDAWAVGAGAKYTAVIWLGNLDRQSSTTLVGATAAGPILFDLLERVEEPTSSGLSDHRPPDLISISTCANTGYPTTPACPRTTQSWALRNMVPTARDPFNKAVEIDSVTGLLVPLGCPAPNRTDRHHYVQWPPEVSAHLAPHRRAEKAAPAVSPGCPSPVETSSPIITSPAAAQDLVLVAGLARKAQKVPLRASVSDPQAKLSWFVDGHHLGTQAPHRTAWWTPTPGIHQLTAIDQHGNTSRRTITVH